MEVVFKTDAPDDLLAKIKIKGVTNDGIEFPAEPLIKDDGSVKYSMKEATKEFPDTIKFYDRDDDAKAFKIDWQMSVDGGPFSSIGESKHQVYLTLAKPITEMRQETLFYVGCKNADGETAPKASYLKIWTDFEDRLVENVDGSKLIYWGPKTVEANAAGGTDHFTVGYLLENKEGPCQGWAEFLKAITQATGIEGVKIANIEMLSLDLNNNGITDVSPVNMFIGNWTYNGPNVNPVINIYKKPKVMTHRNQYLILMDTVLIYMKGKYMILA